MNSLIEKQLRDFKNLYEDVINSDHRKQYDKLLIKVNQSSKHFSLKSSSGMAFQKIGKINPKGQNFPSQKLEYFQREILENGKIDAKKVQPQTHPTNNLSNPFESLIEEVKSFQRDVLGSSKMNMTDFEALRWKNQKQKKSKLNLENSSLLKISELNEVQKLQHLEEWTLNFPILSFTTNQLCELSSNILLTSTNFCKKNHIQKETLLRMNELISQQYNMVSYHSYSHAFSLFQHMQSAITQLHTSFDDFDLFFASIAALAHDMGHTGLNSHYEIKKKSHLALFYNNQSVLENMHIYQFNQMLRSHPEVDIISQLQHQQQRQKSRKLIANLILSTDMSNHMSTLKKISTKNAEKTLDLTVAEDKQLILEIIFHGCDIGNPCLNFQEYLNWSVLLSHEFHEQAEREECQEMEISPFFRYTNLNNFYQGQINFINTFSLPLWKEISISFQSAAAICFKIEKNVEILKGLCNEK